MTADEKLAAILAAVQTDPGNRGLARDPADNLFTATAGNFQAASQILAQQSVPKVWIGTGFVIPSATPPSFETDGPLGAVFLYHAICACGGSADILAEEPIIRCVSAAEDTLRQYPLYRKDWTPTAAVWIERAGPATDGRCYTMRGRDITSYHDPRFSRFDGAVGAATIGIGDGGNEIGMGRIPHETVARNIPNGDLIHCRVPCDHLIVAGVSNWGAYALAAGLFVLRGVTPPADLFDPDRERAILEVMVREGPLVDGVTGQQTATVDGLTWDEYAAPLIRIREILES